MLNQWHESFPGRIESMFTAMQNVVPSHLCDSELFDFANITQQSGVINGGDKAFDQETFSITSSVKTTDTPDKSLKNYLASSEQVNITQIN
jgi:tRNA 2-thiocytidine biosynthesis protein TtcA